MIEEDNSHSIVVASTSSPDTLDRRLFNRFDEILEYDFPNELQIAKLLKMRLRSVARAGIDWRRLARLATGLSYSDVSRSANDVLKMALISEIREVGEWENQCCSY